MNWTPEIGHARGGHKSCPKRTMWESFRFRGDRRAEQDGQRTNSEHGCYGRSGGGKRLEEYLKLWKNEEVRGEAGEFGTQ